jgi:hypothetical protein
MELPFHLPKNLSLLNALRLARRIGCSVEPRRGTDELVIRHALRPTRPLTVKGNRKDAPRSLLSYIRRCVAISRKVGNPSPFRTSTAAGRSSQNHP